MKIRPLLLTAAGLLLLCAEPSLIAAPPPQSAPAKPLTRADIERLPIVPEARAELIVKLGPKDVPARLLAAREYLHAPRDTPQNVASAKRHLDEALKLAPNRIDVLALAGDVALRRNQPAEALDYYQRAVRLSPEDASLQVRLGAARQRTGDAKGADAAYDAYRRIRQLPPLERGESRASP